MRPGSVVIVFARAPVPGEAKTRLIPALGAWGASELYRCFVLDTLARSSELSVDVMLAAAEADQVEALRSLAQEACPRAEIIVQTGSDLGERMSGAFQEALGRGYPGAVLIGTDAPSLPFDRVDRALSLLRHGNLQRGRQYEAVLGPCLDGGYYLIGLRAPMPQLFQHMVWGTRSVLVDTLRRAQSLKASVSLLEPWYDVDTPEDLELLRSHLTALFLAGETIPCPATWHYLQEQLAEQ